LFFFFQAEDGIRDRTVTGVQTCALPISRTITANATGSPSSVRRTSIMTICLVPELALQRRSERGFRGVILAFVSASRHYMEISCEDRMQLVPERPDTKLTGDVLPQGRGGSKSQELGRGLGGAR